MESKSTIYFLKNLTTVIDSSEVKNINALIVKYDKDTEKDTSSTYVISQKEQPEKYDKIIELATKLALDSAGKSESEQGQLQSEFSDKVLELVLAGTISDLQDSIDTTDDNFVSAHVHIHGNRVYVDDTQINPALEKQIIDTLETGIDNKEDAWQALVHFTEKLYSNCSVYVRNQLYGFIQAQSEDSKLTLTPEGNFIAYKGGSFNGEKVNGKYVVYSVNAGHGFVNGQEFHDSQLPNQVGDIVEIPRQEVDDDPETACSTGLHAGTWGYASKFARGATMTVEIDPADVVSVPSDYGNQKIRTSRYKVIDIVHEPIKEVLFKAEKPVIKPTSIMLPTEPVTSILLPTESVSESIMLPTEPTSILLPAEDNDTDSQITISLPTEGEYVPSPELSTDSALVFTLAQSEHEQERTTGTATSQPASEPVSNPAVDTDTEDTSVQTMDTINDEDVTFEHVRGQYNLLAYGGYEDSYYLLLDKNNEPESVLIPEQIIRFAGKDYSMVRYPSGLIGRVPNSQIVELN